MILVNSKSNVDANHLKPIPTPQPRRTKTSGSACSQPPQALLGSRPLEDSAEVSVITMALWVRFLLRRARCAMDKAKTERPHGAPSCPRSFSAQAARSMRLRLSISTSVVRLIPKSCAACFLFQPVRSNASWINLFSKDSTAIRKLMPESGRLS